MPFIVIAAQRTGSTHLANVLSGHPQILCNGNVFKPSHIQLSWPNKKKTPEVREELTKLRSTDPAAFVDRIFAAGFGRSHVGFEIFPRQNDEMLFRMLENSSITKIILYRKNVLANYSSLRLARTSGNWTSHGNRPDLPIKFNDEQFIAFHDEYVSFYKSVMDALTNSAQRFFFLNYEDINIRQIISGVVSFIGADSRLLIPQDPYNRLQRQHSSSIADRFANKEVVEAFLAKHDLMHWRYEEQTSLCPLEGP